MAAADVPINANLTIATSTWTRSTGYTIAMDLLKARTKVDAVFCFNDSLALGLMKGLQAHGVRVSDDVVIIGWDDIEECSFSTPTLTSVAPDRAGIARLAVDHLLARISGTPIQATG